VSVEDLLARLASSDGHLRVRSPSDGERAAWRRAIHAVKQQGRIPGGHHLRHTGRDKGDLVIRLMPGRHPDEKYRAGRPPPIPVPHALDQLHPVIANLATDTSWPPVSTDSRNRALRLVQALLTEADRRGYRSHPAPPGPAGLVIEIEAWSGLLMVGEETDNVWYTPTAADLAGRKLYTWQRIQPELRECPSGRLFIELDAPPRYEGRPRRWADRTRWRLDDKLEEILAELQHRADIEQQPGPTPPTRTPPSAALATFAESAVNDARQRTLDDYHATRMRELLVHWIPESPVLQFCDELDRAARTATPSRAESMRSWAAWAREHVDIISTHGQLPDLPIFEPRVSADTPTRPPDHDTPFPPDR
jgi:hypothetical protein